MWAPYRADTYSHVQQMSTSRVQRGKTFSETTLQGGLGSCLRNPRAGPDRSGYPHDAHNPWIKIGVSIRAAAPSCHWLLSLFSLPPNGVGTNSKCSICSKTVYAMEFVGAQDKAFHVNCFRFGSSAWGSRGDPNRPGGGLRPTASFRVRCCVCNTKLRTTDYSTKDDKFYCPTHCE